MDAFIKPWKNIRYERRDCSLLVIEKGGFVKETLEQLFTKTMSELYRLGQYVFNNRGRSV